MGIDSYFTLASLFLSIIYQLVFLDFVDCLYVRKKHATKVLIIVILFSILGILVQRRFHFDATYLYPFQILLLLIGLKNIYHVSWLMSLYLAFMSRFYIYVIVGIVHAFMAGLAGVTILELYYDEVLYGTSILVSRVLSIGAFILAKHKLMIPNRGRELVYLKRKLYHIIMIQLFMSFITLTVMAIYKLELDTRIYLTFFIAIMTVTFFATKMFYEEALSLNEIENVYEYSNDLKHQIVRQANHYDTFKEEIERFKRLDHDYQSMLAVLESLIGNSPTKETNDFINGFVDEIKEVQSLNSRFCNNVVLDALFTEMFKICKRQDIRFDANVYMDEKINISNFDIVRVANNLLKNAIEASMKIEPSKRFIKIYSTVNQGWTVFSVENAYNGYIKKTGKTFFTTKEDTRLHGNGLKIVKELIEKRGGIMIVDTEHTEKVFKVKMTLRHK